MFLCSFPTAGEDLALQQWVADSKWHEACTALAVQVMGGSSHLSFLLLPKASQTGEKVMLRAGKLDLGIICDNFL